LDRGELGEGSVSWGDFFLKEGAVQRGEGKKRLQQSDLERGGGEVPDDERRRGGEQSQTVLPKEKANPEGEEAHLL